MEQGFLRLENMITALGGNMSVQFAEMNKKLDANDGSFQEVFRRLDKIEFNTSGQDSRVSTLEDKMRQVATKIGLNFN